MIRPSMKVSPSNKLLAALVIILACAFIGGSGLNYSITKNAVHREIVMNDLPLTMNNIYSDLSAELIRPILVASSMAADTFLKEWVLDGEQDTSKVQNYLYEIKEKYGFFSAFFVSSLSANYYHFKGTHKKISLNDDHDVWYFKFISSDMDYDLDVDNDEASDNILTVFINHRVVDKNDRLLGVTGVGMQVESIASLVASYREKYNRTVYLTDRSGTIQVHEQTLLIDKANISEMDGLSDHAEEILNDTAGLNNYEYSKNGETILLNVRYIEELGWYLFVEQNETATLKTVRMNFLRSIGIGFCASVFILLLTFVTLRSYQKKIEQLVDTDEMTGLANRRRLEKEFEKYVYLHSRDARVFSIILMDLDGFKDVNDKLGHMVGDQVLKQIAVDMRKQIRPSDILARWGGDEFAWLVEADKHTAAVMAERIRMEVANTSWLDGEIAPDDPRGKITISCGISEYREEDSLDGLLQRADNALYRIKKHGGNGVSPL